MPPGVLSAATPAKPAAIAGNAVAQSPAVAGGKQTIVIASPRPNLPVAGPAKILTAMPRGVAGTPGAQYIVVTSRPGGTAVAGSGAPALAVSPGAGGQRVISK